MVTGITVTSGKNSARTRGEETDMTETDKQSLFFVLDGLDFPAHRWEILVKADLYGADSVTKERLQRLPSREHPYHDLLDVVSTLDRTPYAA
jgi:hypothetical protein